MGKLGNKDMDQLEQWMPRGPKTFTLLYSITRDGCSNETFHQKCDNQGPTVTVLYNNHGSVFGGYTGVSWASTDGYATDSAAFLYRLYLNGASSPVKFPRNPESKNDIFCSTSRGPSFGNDNLDTFSGTISSAGGLFKLSGKLRSHYVQYYNMQGGHLTDRDDDQLTVTELEVYRVTDGDRHPLLEKPWRLSSTWNEKFLLLLLDEAQSLQPPDVDLLDKANLWVPTITITNFLVANVFEINFLLRLLDEVQSFQPPDVDVSDRANLLLIGPVGAGKSSFINTLNSIMAGKITQPARSGSAEQSLTTVTRYITTRCAQMYSQYRQHTLKTQSGAVLKFRLCDTRGLEETQGLDVLEFDSLLNGHIPNFYEFNPTSPITQDHQSFIAQPRPSDKINCAVFVIDATTLDVIAGKVMQKIKSFIARLNQKGIPSVILLTHVDRLCPNVDAAVTNVFRSSKVKNEIEKAADTFGLPRINVMPLKNYENEMELQEDISILTLLAVKKILDFAADHLSLLGERFQHLRVKQGANADA